MLVDWSQCQRCGALQPYMQSRGDTWRFILTRARQTPLMAVLIIAAILAAYFLVVFVVL